MQYRLSNVTRAAVRPQIPPSFHSSSGLVTGGGRGGRYTDSSRYRGLPGGGRGWGGEGRKARVVSGSLDLPSPPPPHPRPPPAGPERFPRTSVRRDERRDALPAPPLPPSPAPRRRRNDRYALIRRPYTFLSSGSDAFTRARPLRAPSPLIGRILSRP